jgi:ATP-dependent RNA circularization protein (DNA/RNA ligase family)
MADFFRFPHTPHLAWLGPEKPRDDKVMGESERKAFLKHELVIEEKVDGANLGFSRDGLSKIQVQNRGEYLSSPFKGQFARLNEWLALHANDLATALGDELILFGEWCVARHSLDYSSLPDWLLVFDVYDRKKEGFWSTQRRNDLAQYLNLSTVPLVAKGRFHYEDLQADYLSRKSTLRQGFMEGLVARYQDSDWTLGRAKLVRPEFVQGIDTHWRRQALVWNQLREGGKKHERT